MSSLSHTLLNTPVSLQYLSGTNEEPETDLNFQPFNEFDAAFGIASNSSYPEPASGPQSPSYSHSHDDTTGDDESGAYLDSQTTVSAKPRTMEGQLRPRRRELGLAE